MHLTLDRQLPDQSKPSKWCCKVIPQTHYQPLQVCDKNRFWNQ